MCIWCDLYGGDRENHMPWYLNPENYGRRQYKKREVPGKLSEFGTAYRDEEPGMGLQDFVDARNNDPEEFRGMVKRWWSDISKVRPSQVIPLKDALAIADICSPIAAMSCECRLWNRGRIEDNEHTYTCTGLGVGMLKWERWPERYKGGVNFLDPEGVKEYITKWDKLGFMHIAMTYGLPFIGGICNCDLPDCYVLRGRMELGVYLLKSHYIAKVNHELCNGCRVCVQRCQVGAIKFEESIGKAHIDQFKCYGCGLCETACPRGAIELLWRESIPALREVW